MQETKILHIAPAYQTKGGGIFEVVENLSASQCKDNKTLVDILCLETFEGRPNLDKSTYSLLPSRVTQLLLMYKTVNFLSNKMWQYDVVHIHGAWSFQFALIVPFVFFFKGKIIYQPHGLLCPIRMKKNWLIKKLAWMLYQRYFLKYSKGIVCCSKKERGEILSMIAKPDKIKVIPNGLDSEFFVEKLTKPQYENRFMFFSQIIPIKNLESVFYAISELKHKDSYDMYLDIYGYGPKSYIIELKSLMNTLSISENILFKGAISRDKRVAVYDEYNYFILPSLSENFAIVVLEALSRGCKAFVSTQTPWGEYSHDSLIMFDPDKFSVYSTLKSQLLSNQQPVKSKSKNGLDLDEFNWDDISAQFNKLYFLNK
jgi:glycosyltransferase involved in cell wall biosynthesis